MITLQTQLQITQEYRFSIQIFVRYKSSIKMIEVRQTAQEALCEPVTGVLKITVTYATLEYQSLAFKMNPYVKLHLSNQNKFTRVIEKGDKNPYFNETFYFNINSCHQFNGRALELTVVNQRKIGPETQVGFGIIDLDPIIMGPRRQEELRCYINYKNTSMGFVDLIVEFERQPSRTLSFQFQNAIIRRRTSIISSMNCWVRVTIGQQELATRKSKDKKGTPASWAGEILSFHVPNSIKRCTIAVYDDEEEVGTLVLSMEEIFEMLEQPMDKQFFYSGETNAGVLRMKITEGMNILSNQPIEQPHNQNLLENQMCTKQEDLEKEFPKAEGFIPLQQIHTNRLSEKINPERNPISEGYVPLKDLNSNRLFSKEEEDIQPEITLIETKLTAVGIQDKPLNNQQNELILLESVTITAKKISETPQANPIIEKEEKILIIEESLI